MDMKHSTTPENLKAAVHHPDATKHHIAVVRQEAGDHAKGEEHAKMADEHTAKAHGHSTHDVAGSHK